MSKTLVIVESPGKIKTIESYLGPLSCELHNIKFPTRSNIQE